MFVVRNWVRIGLEVAGILPRSDLSCRIATVHPHSDSLLMAQIVVVRDPNDKWACFRCPCGCGETTKLSLSSTIRPRWKINIDGLNRPTISPSVRQMSGCLSHYWIKAGRVIWCRDSGKRQ